MSDDLISVILPVYNEAPIIKSVLQALMRQKTGKYRLEILVIDGMSTDGSQEIVAEMSASDRRIRLVVNENRKTPYALNLGLQEAMGGYMCILGAHCIYDEDYIHICLTELLAHQAEGCSGKVITEMENLGPEAELVSWVMSHPFGVSSSSFRTQPEGFVDTIPYPVFKKKTLLDLGGYDVNLTRNQDNDMNYRLRKAGYKLYCTWKTKCKYFARTSIRSLLEYGYNNGVWCSANFRKDPKSLGLRHYVPLLFLLSIFLSLGLFILSQRIFTGVHPLMILLLAFGQLFAHLFVGSVVSAQFAVIKRRLSALFLPILFLAFHLSYGWGFLAGLIRLPNLVVGNAKAP
jgi:glycosyltransferase involved in cell wall biosynthesis